jgi:subtilase family serine protease
VTPLQAQGLTGLDRSIAVIARSNFLDSDIAAFSQRFLPGVLLTPRREFAGLDPGVLTDSDERIEVLLDTQWAGALAPGARVNVVISTREGNIPEAVVKAVDERLGDVITISFGLCEAAWQTSTTELFDAFYAIANLQGQTVLVASGDAGAFDCSPDSSIVSVNALASSPHAVAVGGSSFALANDGTVPARSRRPCGTTARSGGGGRAPCSRSRRIRRSWASARCRAGAPCPTCASLAARSRRDTSWWRTASTGGSAAPARARPRSRACSRS